MIPVGPSLIGIDREHTRPIEASEGQWFLLLGPTRQGGLDPCLKKSSDPQQKQQGKSGEADPVIGKDLLQQAA